MKNTISMAQIIKEELDLLQIGEYLDKKEFVKKYYGKANNTALTRIFDVQFCSAKKLMPGKKFRTAQGKITRLL